MSDEISESIRIVSQKLEANDRKRTELMDELKASLALQELWPRCFEHGSVICRIEGSPAKGFKFLIKNRHEEKSFDLQEIPVDAIRGNVRIALHQIYRGPKCKEQVIAKELLGSVIVSQWEGK